MRPPAGARFLRESGSDLPRAYVKPPSSFKVRQAERRLRNSALEFLSRERSETNRLYERVSVVPKNPEEVGYLAIYIVVSLHWRRGAVYQNRGGTAEWLAIVFGFRK